jgi:HAD superfamily hydrolase (TIGR01509 family)
MARRINAILFDLGDTLLDFGSVDLQKLFNEGARLAYDYLAEMGHPLPSFSAYRRRHLFSIRWHALKAEVTGREFSSLSLMDKLCQKMGLDLDHAQLVKLCSLWYEPLRRCGQTEPGLREMLIELNREGLQLAVVSNTFIPGEVLDLHLQAENLYDQLPVRVYSCDVGYRKPHRKIFEQALEKLENTPPESCLFVGDSPRADIRGASRMNMVTVLKDPNGKNNHRRIQPDHRIQKIVSLSDILAEYQTC